jgi:hypothetical protein
LAERDVDSLENQNKASAILQPLLQQYPDHPGVAHYLIGFGLPTYLAL